MARNHSRIRFVENRSRRSAERQRRIRSPSPARRRQQKRRRDRSRSRLRNNQSIRSSDHHSRIQDRLARLACSSVPVPVPPPPTPSAPSPTLAYTRLHCLGVFGMSYRTTEQDLRRIFEPYGHVEVVKIVYDPKTRESRGFGFVYFRQGRHARRACEQCNGLLFDRRNIRVAISKTDKPHDRTPGQYMGRERRGWRNRSKRNSTRFVSPSPSPPPPAPPARGRCRSPSMVPFVHPRFRPIAATRSSKSSDRF